jgi:hypothetical protein
MLTPTTTTKKATKIVMSAQCILVSLSPEFFVHRSGFERFLLYLSLSFRKSNIGAGFRPPPEIFDIKYL